MDEHQVTVAEFRRFVKATGHVTLAERPPSRRTIRTPIRTARARSARVPPDERPRRPGRLPQLVVVRPRRQLASPRGSWKRHEWPRPPPGDPCRVGGRRGLRASPPTEPIFPRASTSLANPRHTKLTAIPQTLETYDRTPVSLPPSYGCTTCRTLKMSHACRSPAIPSPLPTAQCRPTGREVPEAGRQGRVAPVRPELCLRIGPRPTGAVDRDSMGRLGFAASSARGRSDVTRSG